MGILDGSRELGTLVLALRSRHRDAGFGIGEIVKAILEVTRPSPHGLGPHRYSRLYVEALVRGGYLESLPDGLFQLGPRARDFCVAWEAERDRELELLASGAEPPPREAPPQSEPDLGTVTRAFLQDALCEAGVPAELLEAILETYRDRGRLTMSQDGGRYKIALA